MKDLTQDSIARHIARMAAPIAIGLLFQTLYFLVDLYFIGPLGGPAIAGVGVAGNVMFMVLALTQVLGVGTVALVSHAAGRKDQQAATAVFNQALVLSAVGCVALLVLGYLTIGPYLHSISSDAATVHAGQTYMYWFLPSLALQFPLIAIGSALRGIGIVQPAVSVQMLSVLLNALLAPILIGGWLTRHGMGVAGAGLASSLSAVFAVVGLWLYFRRADRYVGVDPAQWRPQFDIWRRILAIGLPSGGEYALLFVNAALVYWAIRHFGFAAQAGFGAGSRIMNAVLLPVIAIAFAAGPIAGQNVGAGRADRVERTFAVAALMIVVVMVPLTLLLQWSPDALMRPFTNDPAVVAAGGQFLRLLSWNFLAQGLIFLCSSMFQGLGNTRPALLSSGCRLLLFAIPLVWLSNQQGFTVEQVWYLSIATVSVQALASLTLLRIAFRRLRLNATGEADAPPTALQPVPAEEV
jgi:putative MATE family efflux protein